MLTPSFKYRKLTMDKLMQIDKLNINGAEINSVNSRQLHKFLGIGAHYGSWVKKQVELFIEDEDFVRVKHRLPSGQSNEDYIVTLDVAKHICMLSRTEQGMKARKYFIDCERQVTALTEEEAYRIASTRYIAKLEQDKLALQSKASALIALHTDDRTWTMMEWADMLANSQGTKMGRNKLLKVLRGLGYIQKAAESKTLPYRQHIPALFVVKHDTNGYPYACVTAQGVEVITPRITDAQT